MMYAKATLFLLLLLLSTSTQVSEANGDDDDDELGKAALVFSGNLEVVAEHDEFQWLESPLWSEEGQFLLFSDVKWLNEQGHTCGMIWKYDVETQDLSKFIPCSGMIGPGGESNISDYIEAGSNGLHWGWKGDAEKDLLICQHGRHRIVRIDLDSVRSNGTIADDDVAVLADSHNGNMLNSPNDLTLVGDTLYFTDPPFGLQYFSAEDPFRHAFDNLHTDIGVYTIQGDPGINTPVEVNRIINFGSSDDPWAAPNGIAITSQGDIFLPITSFDDPRFQVYDNSTRYGNDADGDTPTKRLESGYRIEGDNRDFPALNDGVTYAPDMDILFATGPAGVYIFNGTSLEFLGLLRIDDLVSNTEVGGGYLWITANQRLVRIPLATTPTDEGDDQSGATTSWSGTVGFIIFNVILVLFTYN